ncbi:hypothetical protein PVT67_02880 [Gallaecimonas kandeliae]|uniref:hypothetical protein n=1 Tax=Gallaecimonas kandeliae TaxID=3029055 RepID=UPI00264727CC|nr:hypothetical protein [Gallaecimonas kandeliae]WKE66207.1 hypothetical protein PVT67_02880 [Gallaecimonas kandeliae]
MLALVYLALGIGDAIDDRYASTYLHLNLCVNVEAEVRKDVERSDKYLLLASKMKGEVMKKPGLKDYFYNSFDRAIEKYQERGIKSMDDPLLSREGCEQLAKDAEELMSSL